MYANITEQKYSKSLLNKASHKACYMLYYQCDTDSEILGYGFYSISNLSGF